MVLLTARINVDECLKGNISVSVSHIRLPFHTLHMLQVGGVSYRGMCDNSLLLSINIPQHR